MNPLEYAYIEYLRMNLICLNIKFAECYNTYKQNHPAKEDFTFYYNEKFVRLMIEELRGGNIFDFKNYDQLDKLMDYMVGIEQLKPIINMKWYEGEYLVSIPEESKEEKCKQLKELSQYDFHDSYLHKVEIRQGQEVCKFYFRGVIDFGDCKDIEEDEMVYAKEDNITLTFHNVKDIKFHGSFTMDVLDRSLVYTWECYKVSDNDYRFAFLCIPFEDYFIVEIIFSGITVESFPYISSQPFHAE